MSATLQAETPVCPVHRGVRMVPLGSPRQNGKHRGYGYEVVLLGGLRYRCPVAECRQVATPQYTNPDAATPARAHRLRRRAEK